MHPVVVRFASMPAGDFEIQFRPGMSGFFQALDANLNTLAHTRSLTFVQALRAVPRHGVLSPVPVRLSSGTREENLTRQGEAVEQRDAPVGSGGL